MSIRYTFNPLEGEFDAIDVSEYISEGTGGITYFRMKSPIDGSLWDAYIDDTGAWVTTAYVPPSAGFAPGLLLALSTLT